MLKAREGISGHEAAFSASPTAGVLMYDPADDGPECEIITRILASHPWLDKILSGGVA